MCVIRPIERAASARARGVVELTAAGRNAEALTRLRADTLLVVAHPLRLFTKYF